MTLKDLLPPGMTPEDAITGLAALSAFLTVLAVWFGLTTRNPGTRRIKELAARRETLRNKLLATPKEAPRTADTFMRQVVTRLNLLRSRQAENITRRLAQAGWRSSDALVRYLFFKLTLPVGVGATAIFLFYGAGLYGLTSPQRLLVTIGAVLVGFYAPEIAIKNQSTKRSDAIRKGLPDALDLMVICAEAGLSLDALLKRVSEEFSKSCPELADELALTSLEMSFLPDRRQALQNLNARTSQPGVRALVNSLLQSDKYGTPLALTIRFLSAEFREERMLKAEEKAARLPAMLTVPMIVFILPPLFIVLIGPAILGVIDGLSSM